MNDSIDESSIVDRLAYICPRNFHTLKVSFLSKTTRTMAFNPPTSDFGFESKEQKKFHQTVYYGEQVSQVTQKLMRESETTTPTPAPTPSNLPPGERPIAPLRRRLPATQGRAATMEERVTQSEVCRMQGSG